MVVLKVVYDNLNGRDIIFSSFHPDICMMLALKQVYPPLFRADVAQYSHSISHGVGVLFYG